MPLTPSTARREIHHRLIDMKAYAREDGHYDVEAHLVDRKPFDFRRPAVPTPIPAGEPLHDLWVRLTVDGQYTVRAVEAASDVTPFPLCKEAEATLAVLVGERVASGWSALVKERLRGTSSCTHLREMLLTMATTSVQAIRGLQRAQGGPMDPNVAPPALDTCYAYAAHREVVLKFWPLHHRRRDAPPSPGQPPDPPAV